MIRMIKINNFNVPVILKSNRLAKNMKILVYSSGRIVMTKPFIISVRTADKFLEIKSDWIKSRLFDFGVELPLRLEKDKKEEEHYRRYHKQAKKEIKNRVEAINKIYAFKYNRISVRNQRTRWGSCSYKRNLSFNYRLIFLEKEAFDYIVAHELCHLQEFNHSTAFWRLVSKVSPNYKYWRKELRNNFKFNSRNLT
jgi:predicted metal-dependent hydrolase